VETKPRNMERNRRMYPKNCISRPMPECLSNTTKHTQHPLLYTWRTGGTSALGISCPMTECLPRTNLHIPSSREKSRSRNMERNRRMYPKNCISRPMPECLSNTTIRKQDPFPHNGNNPCTYPLCISAPTPECRSGTNLRIELFLRETRCVLRAWRAAAPS